MPSIREVYQQADEETKHLRPKHEAAYIGIACGAGAAALVSLFCWLGGLDVDRFTLPSALVVGIAGIGPYVYYRAQWRAYFRVQSERLATLRGQLDGHTEIPPEI